jgi:ribonuclease HI
MILFSRKLCILVLGGEKMENVVIYTDGACSGNPGPGGWGSILMYKDNKKEISGGNANTTNNVMELTAVIEALKLLKFQCNVSLYSDSAYVVNAFNQKWIYGWMKNGWKNASKEPVKNKELWQELYDLTKFHNVTFIKVKGHSDNEYNNRCDELARNAIDNVR